MILKLLFHFLVFNMTIKYKIIETFVFKNNKEKYTKYKPKLLDLQKKDIIS